MVCSEFSRISVSRRGSRTGYATCAVVWVGGEHDITTKVSLLEAIAAAAAQRDKAHVLVDLSEVTFMDASTIGAIVGSRNRLRPLGQLLEVRAPSPTAHRLLELCDLGHLVHSLAVETAHPAGVAAALSTWVDVRSIQPNGAGGRGAARVPGRPMTRQRDRVVATGDNVEEAAATVEVDRGGP